LELNGLAENRGAIFLFKAWAVLTYKATGCGENGLKDKESIGIRSKPQVLRLRLSR
jgi:hypothetical protein